MARKATKPAKHNRVLHAAALQCAGIVLMLISMVYFPPLVGFLVPLVFYVLSFRNYEREFWKAWMWSIVFLIVLMGALVALGWFDVLGEAILEWGQRVATF